MLVITGFGVSRMFYQLNYTQNIVLPCTMFSLLSASVELNPNWETVPNVHEGLADPSVNMNIVGALSLGNGNILVRSKTNDNFDITWCVYHHATNRWLHFKYERYGMSVISVYSQYLKMGIFRAQYGEKIEIYVFNPIVFKIGVLELDLARMVMIMKKIYRLPITQNFVCAVHYVEKQFHLLCTDTHLILKDSEDDGSYQDTECNFSITGAGGCSYGSVYLERSKSIIGMKTTSLFLFEILIPNLSLTTYFHLPCLPL